MKDQKTEDIVTLRIPQELMDFVRRNPVLTEKLGKLVVRAKEYEEAITRINNLFTCPECFSADIQNGTEEELISLLECFIEKIDKAEMYTMTKAELQDFVKAMGSQAVYTKID